MIDDDEDHAKAPQPVAQGGQLYIGNHSSRRGEGVLPDDRMGRPGASIALSFVFPRSSVDAAGLESVVVSCSQKDRGQHWDSLVSGWAL